MSGILFDIDFTLIDPTSDLLDALSAALRPERAAPPDPDKIRYWVGDGVGPLVSRAMRAASLPMTPDLYHRVLTRFLRIYGAAPSRRSTLLPGVLDLLETLQDDDRPMAVCTNKPEALTRRILSDLSLSPFFQVVIGGDTLPHPMPDPAPVIAALNRLGTTGVFIGSSLTARQAAAAAGVPFYLYTDDDTDSSVRSFTDYAALPELLSHRVSGQFA